MTTAKIARRQRDAGMVAAAARAHAGEAAERVEPLLARVAPGGEPFHLDRLQEAFGLLLDEARRGLEVADATHRNEERDDLQARERRGRAAAVLHERLVRVRDVCEAVYGRGAGSRVLGLRGRTARRPEELRRQAAQAIHCLREGRLPSPRALGLAPDPGAWVEQLEASLADLEAALRRVHRDRRARETTLHDKLQAIRRFDRAQSAVTGFLAALYRLGELDHYEERLRPKRGRPRRREEEAAPRAVEAAAIASVAAGAALSDGREALRAAPEEPARALEPPAAAAGGPIPVVAFPAAAAPLPRDFSEESPPAARDPIAFSGPPAPAAHEASDFSGAPAPVADETIAIFGPSATAVAAGVAPVRDSVCHGVDTRRTALVTRTGRRRGRMAASADRATHRRADTVLGAVRGTENRPASCVVLCTEFGR